MGWVHPTMGKATGMDVSDGSEHLTCNVGGDCWRERRDRGQGLGAHVGGGEAESLAITAGGHKPYNANMVKGRQGVGLVAKWSHVATTGHLDHHDSTVDLTHGGVESRFGIHVVKVPAFAESSFRPPPCVVRADRGGCVAWRYPLRVVAPFPETAPPGPTPWAPPPAGPLVPRWGMGDVAVGILLFFGVQLAAGVLIVIGLGAIGSDTSLEGDSSGGINLWLLAVSAPLSWAVLIGWPWWVSRSKGSGSLSRDFGLAIRWTDPLLGLAGGAMALGCSVVLAISYSAVFGSDAPTNADLVATDSTGIWVFISLFVTVAVGTPIAEEVFFRGLVLGAARRSWGIVVGVAFSSLMFGAIHVQSELTSWAFVGVVTATYGVVFALLRVWSQGRIAASIVAHMVVNGVAVTVIFFGA